LDESSVIWPRSGMTADGQCWELPTLERRTSGTDSGLWPTPTVCGNYNRKGASPASGDGLATAVLKCATPTARDWRSGKASQATMERNSRPLSEQIGGSLNPTWVEWLMGFPLGWTDLKPLEMHKYHSAQQPHGGF
jgi:DNA (cytosine-5)-methyltransferase 1